MIIDTATLYPGTRTRSRLITYKLDSSGRIHGAMHVEELLEHFSEHREGYTDYRHMHKEYSDNLLAGLIKLDQWSNACGRNVRVPQ